MTSWRISEVKLRTLLRRKQRWYEGEVPLWMSQIEYISAKLYSTELLRGLAMNLHTSKLTPETGAEVWHIEILSTAAVSDSRLCVVKGTRVIHKPWDAIVSRQLHRTVTFDKFKKWIGRRTGLKKTHAKSVAHQYSFPALYFSLQTLKNNQMLFLAFWCLCASERVNERYHELAESQTQL